jgi:hypothetical protein
MCLVTFGPTLWALSQVPTGPGTVDLGNTTLPNEPQPQSPDETVTDAITGQQGGLATGRVTGVALAENGTPLFGARVTIRVEDGPITAETTAGEDGAFSIPGLPPGTYRISITLRGLEPYLSAPFNLHAGEAHDLQKLLLRVGGTETEVTVTATPEQVATEQIKAQEKQRVLGVFPNFYTSYIWKAAPMTSKQKFKLAIRATTDPITFLTVAGVAGGEQFSNTFPGYGGGAEGYAKRFGSRYADAFSSRLIGSAILPSLLHQDPRYFYRGTGSIPSRVLYAMSSAVITRGDKGQRQPNYSRLLGNLAAGGISNLYRPDEDRGVALTFESTLISAGVDAVGNVVREFLLRGFTPSVPSYANGKAEQTETDVESISPHSRLRPSSPPCK